MGCLCKRGDAGVGNGLYLTDPRLLIMVVFYVFMSILQSPFICQCETTTNNKGG